jgi:acetyl esterase/lipase
MNRPLLLASVLVLTLVISACTVGPEASPRLRQPVAPQPVASEKDQPYTSSRLIDAFYPDSDGPWPTIVLFHGGEENKGAVRGLARAAAEAGLVVFAPDYRDSPQDLDANPVVALEDAACAMRYARAHAADFGGRGDRLVSAGHSFGGAMAAIMALDGDRFRGDCLVNGDLSARATGVVGLDGVYDMGELDAEFELLTALDYVDDGPLDESLTFHLLTGRVEQLHRQGERFRDALAASGHKVTLTRKDLNHVSFVSSSAPGIVDALVALAYGQDQ